MNKVFFYDEPKEINLDSLSVQLPENWLDSLGCLLQQESNLDRHLAAYPSLKDHLKIIFHRLEGNLDNLLAPLIDSGRQEIIDKLRDEIHLCSEGFYNRTNQIILSLQRPQNLSQLFHVVREVFVKEKIAFRLTKDVHTFNAVTRIANSHGLGIKVNYARDQYSGQILAEEIAKVLKQEFETFFTPCALPYLFVDLLRGLLAQLGYDSRKEENGYVGGCRKNSRDGQSIFV